MSGNETVSLARERRARASLRNRRRALWIWTACVVAFFLWQSASYRGLYRWLAEWQIDHFGRYVPMLTIAGLSLLVIAPMALLARERDKDIESAMMLSHPRVATMRSSRRSMRVLLFCAAVFAMLAVGSLLWTFFLPTAQGVPQEVALADRGRVDPVEGHTRLEGIAAAGPIAQFRQRWPLDGRLVSFAPVFPAGRHDRVPRYFVQVTDDEVAMRPSSVRGGERTGILVHNGLPGSIELLYREIGYPAPRDYYTLYTTQAPILSRFYVLAAQFGLCALLLALVGLFQRRHYRALRGASRNPSTTST